MNSLIRRRRAAAPAVQSAQSRRHRDAAAVPNDPKANSPATHAAERPDRRSRQKARRRNLPTGTGGSAELSDPRRSPDRRPKARYRAASAGDRANSITSERICPTARSRTPRMPSPRRDESVPPFDRPLAVPTDLSAVYRLVKLLRYVNRVVLSMKRRRPVFRNIVLVAVT